MSTATEKQIIQARINLLFHHPFFGQMATRMKLVDASDWCKTAATDGRNFFYNIDFINKLDAEEVVFLVGHELGHCIFEHMLRRDDRNPQIWNMAGDYVINGILKRERIGRVITTVPALIDSKYDNMTTEQVYDMLIEEGAAIQNTLDEHLDMADGDGDDGDDGDGDGGRPRPMNAGERKALQDEIKEAMISAAQCSGAGQVPGEIKRLITQITEPKMNWREILRASIESTIRSDFSFQRPSRKGWHIGAILPGMIPDTEIDICLAIDTSGSISQTMLQDFVGEIAGIMEQYKEYRIEIWQFDTAVYGYEVFTHDDGRDICEYEIKGGGGTDFEVNWAFMEENAIEPKQFIMFTDGQPWNSWGNPDYCDTVFMIHDEHNSGRVIEAPFGITVQYDSDV